MGCWFASGEKISDYFHTEKSGSAPLSSPAGTPLMFRALSPPGRDPHPHPPEGLPTTGNSSWLLRQMAPWTLDTLSKTSKLDVQETCCHHNVTGTHLTRSEQSWPLLSGRRPQACWPCLCGLGHTSDACGTAGLGCDFPWLLPAQEHRSIRPVLTPRQET